MKRSGFKSKPREDAVRKASKSRYKPRTASKPKKPKLTTLRKKLDAIFSKYIRTRDGGQCYTCPHKDDPKRMQNGHFVPRQYLALRYDEVNCHCQCYACNMLFNGQPSVYALNLERDYGIGTVERLEIRRQELTKNFPYQELIEKYEKLL